jgi:predicted nucleic acid-binding protein
MKALFDTDILLDVALGRTEFLVDSAEALGWAEDHPGLVAVAWHSLSNLAYLVRPDPREFIRDLLTFVEVASVGTVQARLALTYSMGDLEDALQAACAVSFGASFLVTRNTNDFRNSPVPAVPPAAFLKAAKATGSGGTR